MGCQGGLEWVARFVGGVRRKFVYSRLELMGFFGLLVLPRFLGGGELVCFIFGCLCFFWWWGACVCLFFWVVGD